VAAIHSAAVLAPVSNVQLEVDRISELLSAEEPVAAASLRRLAENRAKALGRTIDAQARDTSETRLARIVPIRREGKELLGADYAFDSAGTDPALNIAAIRRAFGDASRTLAAQGAGSLRLMGLMDVPACYADGARSIVQIRDAVAAEYTPLPLEILETYFLAFERAGVMKLGRR
jgi:hypothetical protein